MGAYQDSVLKAWKQVNAVTASLELNGATSAFRQAVAKTDFRDLAPAWEFGTFKVYVLDWLQGTMVYVDIANNMAVVGRYLWTIMCTDYEVHDAFVDDLINGASGVKVIDYNSGPYRAAGQAWRRMQDATVSTVDPMDALKTRLQGILTRVSAISDNPGERSSEQYQVLFTDLGGASEDLELMRVELDKLTALLDLARGAVATL
ncbi:MAG: hypothetical protein EOO70_02610 [Myxococcaceae bacterium]|nr:MAG: hypothetical protein EOO70_02610 [Myxococcaceae bacterium]